MLQGLNTLREAWKKPEIRSKLLFVLLILILYRIGAVMPIPFVDASLMNVYFTSLGSGNIFNYLNALAGGAFSNATLFALSVSPYITASIVLQLLDVAFPSLFGGKNADDETKRKKMTAGTRITTVILALLTSFGYYMIMRNNNILTSEAYDPSSQIFVAAVIITCYCAGAALIMWMAEKIEEKGIGNGISLILLANILSSLGATAGSFVSMIQSGFYDSTAGAYTNVGGGILSIGLTVLSLAITLAVIMLVIWVTGSEHRIKIVYAKRVVGRKMYGGQTSNLPLKVNMAGVMPIIFASSIVSIPATIIGFCGMSNVKQEENGFVYFLNQLFSITASPWSLVYMVLMFLLIIGFSYFYIMISFDPVEVANNLQKQGGQIQGVRPGTQTAEKIKGILSKVTLIGAFFLAFVAIFPMLVTWITQMCNYSFASIAFGGTSLLIVIGVIQETAQAIEAELAMRGRATKGFLG